MRIARPSGRDVTSAFDLFCQPQQATLPAGRRAVVAVAAVSQSRGGLAEGLVRLRRGKEACWVDPLAESARYEQLLAEGFSA